ncbi:MAG: Gx transporter family protein [Gammaproteobacteria bacterium]|nr:MAG: Gx transporter family protein [Gammaproteobacteria bacterium]
MAISQRESVSIFPAEREDQLVAGLAALAIAIHILEAAFPSPLPGIKPGLANVVTVVVYLRYGFRVAAWVALLRVLVGSLLIGTFLSPTFLLSATGAVAAIGVLGVVGSVGRNTVGALGLSVAAALAHMSGQIWVAYSLFIPHPALLSLAPILLSAALVFGSVSGLIAANVDELLRGSGDQAHE